MAKLEIDYDRCIKAGECYLAFPNLFQPDEDGFPQVLVEEPEGKDLESAKEAAYACPGRAIIVEEDGTE